MNKELISRLLKKSGIVLGVYFIIGLIYIAFSLSSKVKFYEKGGNSIDDAKLNLTYNDTYIY